MMIITAFKSDFDPMHYFEAPNSLIVQTARAGYLEVPTELACKVESAFIYGCIYNSPRNATKLFERYHASIDGKHYELTNQLDGFLETFANRWIAVEYI